MNILRYTGNFASYTENNYIYSPGVYAADSCKLVTVTAGQNLHNN